MNTPLQQAAQELLDRWDSTYWKDQRATSEYVNALRVALEAEQAQAIEALKATPEDMLIYRNIAKQAQQVAVPDGYALAMAVLQSSLYQFLDDVERSECDALIAAAQGVKQ